MDWINVKTRLPKCRNYTGHYWVCINSKDVRVAFLMIEEGGLYNWVVPYTSE